MPPISALGALNVFDLRSIKQQEPIETKAASLSSLMQPTVGYTPNHPKVSDSEGVPTGTSPLGRKMDICW